MRYGSAPKPLTSAARMDAERTSPQPKHVLVVDDESALRLLCQVNLTLEGHTVHEAATLAEARAALERHTIDVLLLDIHVGPEDGIELLDEIEALELPIRVILFSGSIGVGPELRDRVAGVLGKPFELAELAAAVADCPVR